MIKRMCACRETDSGARFFIYAYDLLFKSCREIRSFLAEIVAPGTLSYLIITANSHHKNENDNFRNKSELCLVFMLMVD